MALLTSSYKGAEIARIDAVKGSKNREQYQHDATLASLPPVGDTTAPGIPGNVKVTVSGLVVTLVWTPSTDNVGVTNYSVHRGTPGFTPSAATIVGSPTGLLYTETLPVGTAAYRIVANDAAGNASVPSGEVVAIVADTSAPSTPPGLQVSAVGVSVLAAWQAAADNVGVTKYVLHRGTPGFVPSAATVVMNANQLSFSENVPGPGVFAYRVAAADLAGNMSVPSPEVTVTVVDLPPPVVSPPSVVTWAASAKLLWQDEFTGTAIDSTKWNVADNSTFGSGNNEEERYMKANTVVSGGTLKLIGKSEATTGYKYTSGMVSTRQQEGKETFKFGGNGKTVYAEIRARLPKGGGWWPAFWLVGAATAPGWPAYGEIDIMEAYGTYPNSIECTYHWSENGSNKQQGGQTLTIGDNTQWHTYGVEWGPKSLKYIVDGKVVQTLTATTGQQVGLNYEHTIILNLAIGGDGPRQYHGWDGTWKTGELPGTYEVDYVRVFQQ